MKDIASGLNLNPTFKHCCASSSAILGCRHGVLNKFISLVICFNLISLQVTQTCKEILLVFFKCFYRNLLPAALVAITTKYAVKKCMMDSYGVINSWHCRTLHWLLLQRNQAHGMDARWERHPVHHDAGQCQDLWGDFSRPVKGIASKLLWVAEIYSRGSSWVANFKHSSITVKCPVW